MTTPSPRLVEDLFDYLRIPSISSGGGDPADLNRAADWVAEKVNGAGGAAEVVTGTGNPLVVGELVAAQPGAPTILIYGHYDVQSADPVAAWTTPPFEPSIRDGRIYARGASDDKGNFYPLVFVACELAGRGELPVNVRVLVDGEEEIGGTSATDWVMKDEGGADCAIVFDSDMQDENTPAITLGVRGIVSFVIEVTVAKRDLHSGMYGGVALNAAHVLHRMLAELMPGRDGLLRDELRVGIAPPTHDELESWRSFPPGAEVVVDGGGRPISEEAAARFYEQNWGDASLDINGIASGDAIQKRTIIPATATARFSIRLAPGQKSAEIGAAAERLLRAAAPAQADVGISWDGAEPAVFDPKARPMELAIEAFEEATGTSPALQRVGGSIPVLAGFHERGIPTVLSGFALAADAFHAVDESFRLTSLGLCEASARALYAKLATLRGLTLGCWRWRCCGARPRVSGQILLAVFHPPPALILVQRGFSRLQRALSIRGAAWVQGESHRGLLSFRQREVEMHLRPVTTEQERPGALRGRSKALIGTSLSLALLAGGPVWNGASIATPSASKAKAAATSRASEKRRVDLAEPTFSDPTSITNPRFPISDLAQVIQLGEEAGESLRVEITLLPKTRTITWKDQRVETLVSQFVAYLDGRVAEVAVDYFAQADDGAVWYFGEKVANYENGVIADHEGTWLAGKDGPPGMIMPPDPKVGDVYRPENIPGLVFEEDTVKKIDLTVAGPRGPVEGAIRVQEHLMDGTTESKIFAPGYGEFRARAEDELVTVALAVPIDALPDSTPAALKLLSSGAAEIFEAARSKTWAAIGGSFESLTSAWEAYRTGSDIPRFLATQMSDALDHLAAAVEAQKPARTRQAALSVGEASLDLQLRYRRRIGVDFDRLVLWARRLLVDSAAGDRGAVAGDVAILKAIRNRVVHTVDPKA